MLSEAAKINLFLVARPLREGGGGDKGLATKKKDSFLKLKKNLGKILWPLKKNVIFLRLPLVGLV